MDTFGLYIIPRLVWQENILEFLSLRIYVFKKKERIYGKYSNGAVITFTAVQ